VRNSPEERRFCLFGGGSLKSRTEPQNCENEELLVFFFFFFFLFSFFFFLFSFSYLSRGKTCTSGLHLQ